jgi:outer membrane receptor protein involved in Fe transport
MNRQLVYGLFLLVTLAGASQSAYAQTSRITGRVADSASAVIANADISVTNVETGGVRKTISNEDGYYSISSLQPGKYRITVRVQGFKPISQDGVTLVVDQVARIDFELEVGELTQVVNVTATAPLLDKDTSSLGQLIDGKQVVDLPMLGRNPYSLVTLVPGARAPQSLNNLPVDMFQTQFVSINGARANQNEYLLDGAPNTNPENFGPTIFPGADSVQEFKVITNNYGAEYGRAAGGVFNVVTRSGTNDFHGSVYEFLRNDTLNANEWFSNRARQKKPSFRFNQFGFTLGGPITIPKKVFGPLGGYEGKNRSFFFTNYEGVRQRQGVTFVGTVPTELQRRGDFSQTRNTAGQVITIYNPFTTRTVNGQPVRDPLPDNRIPDNLIDPVAKAMLQFLPLPNTAGNPVTGVNNFTVAASQKIDKDIFTARLDHQLSDKQRLSGRYSYDNSPWNRPIVYSNIGSPSFGAQIFTRHGLVLNDTYTFNPTTLGDFKYSFNRQGNTRFPLSNGYDLTQLGFPSTLAGSLQFPSIPAVTITGFNVASSVPNVGTSSSLGGTDYILFGLDTHVWQASLTKTIGQHTMKTGGEFRLVRRNRAQRGDVGNNFTFTPAFTQGPNPTTASVAAGYSFASFMLGTPNSGQIIIIPSLALQTTSYALYWQDDYKVTPKLTLNLGVRYDYESPNTERYNQLTNFDFNGVPPLTAPGLNLKGGLAFAGVNNIERGHFEPDRNNFAPRFGFAWNVASKTVVRGGAGLFIVPNFAFSAAGNSGFTATSGFVPSLDGVTPLNLLRNPYPQGIRQPTGSSRGLGTLLGEDVIFVDRNLRSPYTGQWNLNIQQELPGKLRLEAAYVGSRGVKLYSDRQLNQLPDSALSLGNALREQVPNPFFGQITSGALAGRTVARGQLLRPFPHFQSVVATGSSCGSSGYHSLQIKGERQFAGGFTLLGAYSFSKLIDDVTGAFAGEAISGLAFQNNNNLRAERSISALDVPQRLTLTYIWELPFGPGKGRLTKGWASKVLGGWQTEAILNFSDGNILGITSAANTTFSFGGGQRPNWNGQNPTIDNPTIDKWFDTSAFSQPPQYTFGNAPRTIPGLRNHGVKNIDFSALKNTQIGEKVNAQFRAEFFNLFNTPRFGLPNTQFGSPSFGTVSNVINSPRIIQFALKLMF